MIIFYEVRNKKFFEINVSPFSTIYDLINMPIIIKRDRYYPFFLIGNDDAFIAIKDKNKHFDWIMNYIEKYRIKNNMDQTILSQKFGDTENIFQFIDEFYPQHYFEK